MLCAAKACSPRTRMQFGQGQDEDLRVCLRPFVLDSIAREDLALGHGNNTAKVDNTAALAAAKEKTAGEKILEEQSAKALTWAGKGDYRNPHDAGMFVNFGDPAMLNRNRELTMNAGNQGISALGSADPNYLATMKENMKAHQAESDAGQYESDIKEGVGNAAAAAGKAEGLDISRKMGVLGVTSDLYRNQKPAWWKFLLSGASQGAGMALGAGV